jgi:pyrroline-5-carboxylate reductase
MTVAILGAGVMGETLASGLIRAGRDVGDLLLTERRPERAAELRGRYGVEVISNLDAAKRAETLVIVVKPQDMTSLLDEIADEVRAGQLVISLAAGVTTALIESRLPDGVAVVRVMPNTPSKRAWPRSRQGPTATTTTCTRPRSCCALSAGSYTCRNTSSTR